MATQKAISGNPEKNGGSTLLHANTTEHNDFRFSERGSGKNVFAPVAGYVQKVISAGEFANDSEGVVLGSTSMIAGQESSAVRITSNKVDNVQGFRGYDRLDIQSVNAFTGVPTFGPNKGVRVQASGLDGQVGVNADHTISVIPGELVYQKGSLVPVQGDY